MAYDQVLSYDTLVSDRRHVSELALPHFGVPQLELHKPHAGVLGMAIYIREGLACMRIKRLECLILL